MDLTWTRFLVTWNLTYCRYGPLDCETNGVNHVQWAEKQHDSESDTIAGHQWRGASPTSAFTESFRWLDQNPIVTTTHDAGNIHKCLAYCLLRGMPCSQASKAWMSDPALGELWEIWGSAAHLGFLKIISYVGRGTRQCLEYNVQNAIDTMKRSPLPRIMRPADGLISSRRFIKYGILTEECYRLTF